MPGDAAVPEALAGEMTRAQRVMRRLSALERAFNARSASPTARRVLLIVALVAFVAISWLSFAALPDGVHLRWWVLPIIALGTTPLTVLCNAAEFRLIGALNRHRISWWSSARLTIIATATNLLPLPGGVVIRTQALRQRGSSYKGALAANAAAGITWIAAGFLTVAVLFAFGRGRALAALVLGVLGIAALAGAWWIVRRADCQRAPRLFAQFVVVEVSLVLVGGLRLFLAMKFIDSTGSFAQATALGASAIIAAAIGIFPAGLGLREALSGAIGAAVGLTAADGVAASASDRVASQIGFAILAGVFVLAEQRRSGRAAATTAEATLTPAP